MLIGSCTAMLSRQCYRQLQFGPQAVVVTGFQGGGVCRTAAMAEALFESDPGPDVAAGAVVTGSHCDAIPLAGAYDGTLGVIGAIAAVRGLQSAGFKPAKPIDVLMFTSEEPTRFGLGCIGRWGPDV